MTSSIRYSICVLLLFITQSKLQAQEEYSADYLDKSTRFAWLTYGVDLNYLTGGSTFVQNVNGREKISFGGTAMPRLTIGGIHFWGHTDFYVSFPLSFLSLQSRPDELNLLDIYQGVETGMRLYPLKLQAKRISPFVGISFRRFRYSQEAEAVDYRNGAPTYGRMIHPIQFGLTYTSDRFHIAASSYYSYQNEFDYYLSQNEQARVVLDPFSFNLSILRYIDTDRSMRSKNAAEYVNRAYQKLKDEQKLSSWFFGIGPSAALQMSESEYLEANHPFLSDRYSAAVLPDITFGRYFHNPDLNLNLSYRTYGEEFGAFDSKLSTRRHSIGLESVKFLFNYLGFVPFAGPIVSYENLYTKVNGESFREEQLALGITFGWDIRVTKTGSGLLRTNLRYYPQLKMDVEGESMMFDHLEFNFIQWVQYIGRKKALRR